MKTIHIDNISSEEFLMKIGKILDEALTKKFTPVKEPYTLLTREETADKFSISIRCLHNWSKNGLLEPYTMGNRVYFRSDEVEEALVLKQYR